MEEAESRDRAPRAGSPVGRLGRWGVHAPAKAECGYGIRQRHKAVDYLGIAELAENLDQLRS